MHARYLPPLLLLLSLPAWADNLYKQVDGDGNIVLQSTPNPRWRTLEVIPVQEPTAAEAAAVQRRREAEARDEAAARGQLEDRVRQQDGAYAELQAALAEVRAAEERREAGREPLAGERLGTVSGFSRLGPAYAARQRQLEAELEAARQRLAAARRAWNEVR